ncbi:MAG: extracellular matrix regulator RemB [Tissierella sp.]|uniref:extracellular matrix regulator RemB n=1 Tax=Tissierella sp. TaxID=41274 RepID=UPI003F9E26B2
MSIYIGENILLSKEDIIAILDSDSILQSNISEKFIKKFKKDSIIKKDKKEVKTYILSQDKDEVKLYESSISSTSIKKKFNMKGLKNIDE